MDEFSDEALAAFLAEEARHQQEAEQLHVVFAPGVDALNEYEMGVLWARIRDIERRLIEAESRARWQLVSIFALAVGLGMIELSLAIHSLR
jgi:hypothetical protein